MRGSSLLLSTISVLALIAGALLLLRSTDESGSAGPVPATTPITEPPVTRSPVTPPPVTPPPVTLPPLSIESTLSVERYDAEALDRFLATLDKATPTTKASAPSGPVPVGTAQDDSPFDLAVAKHVGAVVYDVATTPGWVWAVAENGLHRVDRATGSIDTTIELPRVSPDLPPGYKANLEAHAGTLWVAHGNVLARVNPESAKVTGTIELDGWGGYGTRPLAVDETGVWVATPSRVLRINPEDLQVSGELPLSASGLVVGAESVWVLVGQTVVRIDPSTLKTVASVTLSRSVGYPSIGTPMTFGQDAVWISTTGLSRIDPETNEVSIVRADPDCCAVVIGFVGDYILAYGLTESDGTVIIDLDSRELEQVFTSRSAVFAIHGDAEGFWAVASRSAMLYRYDLRPDTP
jgi:hypothetical protein